MSEKIFGGELGVVFCLASDKRLGVYNSLLALWWLFPLTMTFHETICRPEHIEVMEKHAQGHVCCFIEGVKIKECSVSVVYNQ